MILLLIIFVLGVIPGEVSQFNFTIILFHHLLHHGSDTFGSADASGASHATGAEWIANDALGMIDSRIGVIGS